MTISYSLAPNPKWYIADLVGKPLAGGFLATFRALDNSQVKLVYQDNAGQFPWPYVAIPNTSITGILFDENGSQGPFYFTFDTANPQELYYLEVYDKNGVLQWTIDDFTPPSGSGGSIITEAFDLENLITNNVMWRNIGASANPVGLTFLKIAPGPHAGLAQTPANAGPDICFIKNNTAATDQLQFLKFTLGSTPLTNDITPVDYLNYACTNSPAGETKKVVQFPITRSVQNLSNTSVVVTIWARCNSGNANLTLQWLQFFGDGNGSSPGAGPASLVTPIATQALTAGWVKYTFTVTIPSVTGGIVGSCGNDGLFLQVSYPLGVSTNIDFTKPSVYLGSIAPNQDYHTYDMIDGVVNAPRTGYIFSSYDLVAPFGYVIMNDGAIGSASSGASTRANVDTFPLYNWLYTNVTIPSTNTLCVVTGYTGVAITDFIANRPMQLPVILGRALASAGTGSGLTSRALAAIVGEEAHTLTIGEMPAHTHTYNQTVGGGNFLQGGPGSSELSSNTGSTGGGGAHNTMQPTSFSNFFIKL